MASAEKIQSQLDDLKDGIEDAETELAELQEAKDKEIEKVTEKLTKQYDKQIGKVEKQIEKLKTKQAALQEKLANAQ